MSRNAYFLSCGKFLCHASVHVVPVPGSCVEENCTMQYCNCPWDAGNHLPINQFILNPRGKQLFPGYKIPFVFFFVVFFLTKLDKIGGMFCSNPARFS